MKIFFAHLNDGSTMLKKADRFEIVDDAIHVYSEGELIAYLDLSVVLFAHIYTKEVTP